jgi:hypothetical protein
MALTLPFKISIGLESPEIDSERHALHKKEQYQEHCHYCQDRNKDPEPAH